MTAPINSAVSAATDLLRCGFPPDDAVDMVLRNTTTKHWSWTPNDAERIRNAVWAIEPNPTRTT